MSRTIAVMSSQTVAFIVAISAMVVTGSAISAMPEQASAAQWGRVRALPAGTATRLVVDDATVTDVRFVEASSDSLTVLAVTSSVRRVAKDHRRPDRALAFSSARRSLHSARMCGNTGLARKSFIDGRRWTEGPNSPIVDSSIPITS